MFKWLGGGRSGSFSLTIGLLLVVAVPACSVTSDTQSTALTANTTVTAEPETVVADGVSLSTIAVRVRGLGNKPVAGSPVFLSTSLPASTVQQPNQVTDVDGRAVGLVSATAPGTATISARVGGPAGVVADSTAQVSFVASSSGDTRLQLSALQASAVANDVDPIAIVLVGPPNAAFLLSGLRASDQFSPRSFVTDEAGRFAATWRAHESGERTLVATMGARSASVRVEFVAGAPTSAQSSLLASTTTAASDGAAAIGLQFVAVDAFGNPVAARPVVFSSVGAPAGFTLTPTSSVTAADGTATVRATSTSAGIFDVRASCDGVVLEASIEFVAPFAFGTTSTFAAVRPSATADGSDSLEFALLARDAAEQPTSGLLVVFSGADANVVLAPPSALTDAAGRANVVVTSIGAGLHRITAAVGNAVLNANALFAAGPVSIAKSTLAIAPNQVVAGPPASTVCVRARDAFGNVVANASVAFSSAVPAVSFASAQATTDDQGRATALVGSTQAGQAKITATVAGTALSANLTVLAGAIDAGASTLTLQATGLAADGVSAVPMVVAVADAYGNPIAGVAPLFASTVAGDQFAIVAPSSQVTDDSGMLSATLVATRSGTRLITVRVGTAVLQAAVNFVPGPLSQAASRLVASPNVLAADGTSAAALTLTARDAFANAIAGQAVSLALMGSGASLTATSGTTNAAGIFVSSLTSTTAGAQQVVGYLGDVNTFVTAPVTFVAGSPNAAASTLVVAPPSLAADGATFAVVTATFADAFTNPVAGQPATITVPGPVTLSGSAAGTTDPQGSLSLAAASTVATQRTVLATSGNITLTAPLAFVALAPDSAASSITAVPEGLTADDVNSTLLTIQARDALGNPTSGVSVGLTATGSANAFDVSGGTTDGNGTFVASLRSHVAESKQVSATFGNGASTVASVTFNAGSPNSQASSLRISPPSAEAGSAVSVQADFADQFDNRTPGLAVTFSSDDGNDTFLPASGVTNAAGVATTSLSTVVAGSKTIVATTAGAIASNAVTFVPATSSSSVTSLSASPNVQVADGASLVALTVRIFDAFLNPVSGKSVSLVSTSPGAADELSPASGVTSAQGTFFSTLTATAAGSHTVSFVVDGNTQSTTVVFVAGNANAAKSSVVASPTTLVADDTALTTLTAAARDAFGNLVANANVALSVSGAHNTLSAASGVTDASGTFVATLHSATAQNKTISAAFDTSASVQSVVRFIPGALDAAGCTLTISPNAAIADGVAAASVVARAADAFGNPIANTPVVLSSDSDAAFAAANGNTNALGLYSTQVRSTRARTDALSARFGASIDVGGSLQWLAGSPNAARSSVVISPSTTLADGNAKTTAKLTLADAYGNAVSGLAVALRASGATATVQSPNGVTDSNGVYTTTVSDAVAEVVTVTAAYNAASSSGTTTFVAGPASAALSTLTASPNSIVANAVSTATLTAQVRDALGNPVAGALVSLNADGAGNAFSVASGNTDASGRFVAAYTTTAAQPKVISYHLVDGNVAASVVAVAGTPNSTMSTLVPAPSVQVADNANVIVLTGTLRDAYGNAAAGRAFAFAVGNPTGNEVLSITSGSTDVAGQATSTIRSNRAATKTITFTGSPAAVQANVTFFAGAPASATSSVAIAPNNVVADNVAAATVTVTVRDGFGNLVPSQSVSLASTGVGDTLGATTGTTAANGVFSTTLRSTRAETKTISAVAGAASVTGTTAFVPGAVSAAASALTAAPNAIVADGHQTSSLSVVAADAYGNRVPSAGVALSASGNNNAFAVASGLTDSAGNFTSAFSSTRAQPKTISALVGGATLTTAIIATAGSPNAMQSSLAIAPNSLVADGNAASYVVVLVRDAFANAVPAQTVAFSSSRLDDMLGSPNATADANGSAATALRAVWAGGRTVTASFAGASVSATTSFVAGAPGSAQSMISLSPNTFVADDTLRSTITVVAKDALNNPVPSASVLLSSANPGDHFSVSSGTTDASGTFTAQLRATAAVSRQIVATFSAANANVSATAVTTAGLPNLAMSSLTAMPGTQVADNVNTILVTGTVRDRFGNFVTGQAVSFASSAQAGADVFEPSGGVIDSSGRITAALRSSKAEAKTISLSAGPATPTTGVVFVAGQPNQALSSFIVSPNHLVANGNAKASALLAVQDAFGNPVANLTISLTASGTANALAVGTSTTDANGVLAALLSSTRAEVKTLSASAPGIAFSAQVEFVPGEPIASRCVLSASPNAITADGNDQAMLTLAVADFFGNAVPNAAVSFAADGTGNSFGMPGSTTSATGVATTSFSTTTAQTKTVSAQAGNALVTALVVAKAGPASAATSTFFASPNQLVADGSALATLTATMRDAHGNLISGLPVAFASSTPADAVANANAITNASGVATATLASTKAEAKTALASAQNVALSQNLTFVAGSPNASLSQISASPNAFVADNVSSAELVTTVLDAFGNRVANTPVFLASAAAGDAFVPQNGNTAADGTFVSTMRSTVAQARPVVAALTTGNVVVAITTLAGSPNQNMSTFSLSPNRATADAVSAVTATVTVRDQYANAVASQAVGFASSNANDVFVQASGQTNAAGVFSSGWRSTRAEEKVATATVGAFSLHGNATFVAGAPNATWSSATASPNVFVADAVSTANIWVTALDAFGNLVPNASVALRSSHPEDQFTPASGLTSATGALVSGLRTTLAGDKVVVVDFGAGAGSVQASATATPGQPNTSMSTLTAVPIAQVADNQYAIALTGLVRDAYGNVVSNQNVTFQSTNASGNDVFSPTAGATDANGQAFTTLRSTKAEAKTVTMTAGPATPSIAISFVAGTPAAAATTVTAAPSPVIADGTAATTLTVRVGDAYGNPVPDYFVSLTASGTANTFAAANGNTSGAGVFTTTLTSTKAQTKTVMATAANVVVSTPVAFVAGAPAAAYSTLAISPNAIVADGVATASAQATIADAFNNPVSNANVAFASSGATDAFGSLVAATNPAGVATTTISTTKAEQKLITATSGAASPTATLLAVAGTPNAALSTLSASPNVAVANGNAAIALVATVRDAFANLVPNTAVFVAVAGSDNAIGNANLLTDANGRCATTLTSIRAEPKTITATATGAAFGQAVLFVAGPPAAAQSSLVATPNAIVANGAANSNLLVTASDAFGNRVANANVVLSSSGSNDSFAPATGITNGAGQFASSMVTTKAEGKALTALIESAAVTANVIGLAGAPNATMSSFSASPNGVVANNQNVASLVAVVRDAFANGVPNQSVSFSSSNANDTIASMSVMTDANGRAATTAASKKAEPKVFTATAGAASLSSNITFVSGSPNAVASSLAVSPNAFVADAVQYGEVVITVRDAFANVVPNQSVVFSSPSGSDLLAASTATTDLAGRANTTLRSTVAQTRTIAASLGAGNGNVTTSVTTLAGSPNAAMSAIALSANTQLAGSPIAVTLAVRDRYANVVPNQAVSFASNNGNDSFVAASATTNAAGVANANFVSFKAESKTISGTAGSAMLSAPASIVAASPNAATSTATISPNSITADAVAQASVAVAVSDRYGNPVGNAPVALTSSVASDVFSAANGNTNASGLFASSVRTTAAGAHTVTAGLGSGNGSVNALFAATAGAPNTTMSVLAATPNAQVANAASTIALQATLRDQYGNVVPNQAATFASSNTAGNDVFLPPSASSDANGTIASAIRSSRAEAKTITLTAGPATPQATVTFVAGAAATATSQLTLTPNAVVANGNAVITIAVQVRDAYLNAVPGQTVTLASSGTANAFSVVSGVTDANGLFTTTLASTKAQAKTVTATAGAAALSGNIVFVAGPASATTSSVVASPNVLVADGVAVSTVTVVAADAYANRAGGSAVSLTSSTGADVFASPTGVADGNGVFVTTFKTVRAEAKTITAQVDAAAVATTLTAIAGSPNASASAVTVSPNAVVANNASQATITATFRDAYGNPVPAQSVGFASSNAADVISVGTATTDSNGRATATVASTKAELKTITASAGSAVVTATANFISGSPNATASTMTVSPNDLVADYAATANVVVVALDAFSNPVGGQAIALSSPSAGDTFLAANGNTDAAGRFATTVRSKIAQSRLLAASLGAGNGNLAATLVTRAGSPNSAMSAMSISPNTVSVVASTTVSLTLRDRYANVVPNQSVTFASTNGSDVFGQSPTTTNASGVAATSYASTVAETKTLVATAGAASLMANVTFVADSPNAATSTFTVVPSAIVADGSSTATATLTAMDRYQNPVASAPIVFTSSVAGDQLSPSNANTSTAGSASTAIRATTKGSRTLTANLGAGNGSVNVALSASAGSPNTAMSTLVASPNSRVADAASTIALVATIRDAYANAVANQNATFTSSNANDIFMGAAGVSDANGQLTATLRSSQAESKTITVTAGAASPQATVVFVAGTPNATMSSIAISPNGVVANGSATTTIAVTLRDAFANPVGSSGVSLSCSGSNNAFGASSGTTNASGVFATSLSTTKAEAKTVTATATTGGASVAAAVSFVADVPAQANSQITASPNSIVANNSALSTLSVVAKDAYGNLVPNANVTLSSSGSNDAFSSSSGITNASGAFSATVRTSKAEAKTYSAQIGNVVVTTSLTATAGSPNSTQTTLSASPTGVVADGVAATTASVVVKDAYANLVPGQSVILTSSNANDGFAAPSGTTDANGRYATTVTSKVAGTKLLTATAGPASATASVSFIAGSPNAARSTLTATPNTIVADNAASASVVGIVVDQYGNAVGGQNVVLSSPLGADAFGASTGLTDANGRVATTVRTTLAQSRALNLSLGAGNGNVAATLLSVAGSPNAAQSSFSLSPNQAVADNAQTVGLTATIRDRYNNLVGNQSVTFASSNASGNDTFGPATVQTNVSGVGSTTLRSTKAGPRSLTATSAAAVLNGNASFVAGAPNATISSIVGTPTPQVADGNQTMALVAYARDVYGNPVSGVSVAWSVGGQNNTLTASTTATDGNGATTASLLKSTKAQAKAVAAAMSIGATNYGSAQGSALFVGGPAVPAQSTVVATNPNAGVVWGNANITLTFSAVDQFGNGSPNQLVTIASSTVNDRFSNLPGYTDTTGTLVSSASAAFFGTRALSASIGGTKRSLSLQFAARAPFCTGTPRFGGLPTLSVGQPARSIVMPDLNNDGLADVVVMVPTGVITYNSRGNGLFAAGKQYSIGCSPNAFVARDLGNDNFVDLAVGCSDANSLKLLINDGSGNFTITSSPNISFTPSGVTSGFLDADSRVDLVGFDRSANLAVPFMNQGNNLFAAASPINLGGGPVDVAIGDLDENGYGDLLVAQYDANQLSRFLRSNTGTFSSGVLLSGLAPVSVAIGLLDSDTHLDVGVKWSGDTVDSVGLGDGAGGLRTASSLSGGTNGAVKFIDVDRDGVLDFLSISYDNGGTTVVRRNFGDATWSSSTVSPYGGNQADVVVSLGDFNGDGYLDIGMLRRGNGAIALTPGLSTAPYFDRMPSYSLVNVSPWGSQLLQVDDYDHDGKLDVASASTGAVTIIYGNGDATFSRGKMSPTIVAPATGAGMSSRYINKGDFNGDGFQDLVISSVNPNSPGITTFMNAGDGNFPSGFVVPVNAYSSLNAGITMAIADFDQDGVPDIVLAATSGSTMLYLHGAGNGNFTFQRSIVNNPVATGISIGYIKAADFNKDGLSDVLVQALYAQGLRLHVANGDGTFQPFVVEAKGIGPAEPVIVDATGDGNLDILISTTLAGAIGQSILTYVGDGNGNFTQTVASPALYSADYAVSGDFNGDGYVDFLGNNSAATLHISYGDGTGRFSFGSAYSTTSRLARGLAAEDFDGDGKMDFLISGQTSREISIGVNSGCLQ